MDSVGMRGEGHGAVKQEEESRGVSQGSRTTPFRPLPLISPEPAPSDGPLKQIPITRTIAPHQVPAARSTASLAQAISARTRFSPR